jgi:3-deoxy-manno-octulosonate cytidylyltransferase (CMP-KDO synthetase)
MDAVVMIPARLGSTRFPGKVLADATGRPMIQHVYDAARASGAVRVVVATDAAEVADRVRAFGGEAVMTSAEHANGSSRLAEAARKLGLADDQIVVNVQGDEPEVEPAVVGAVVRVLERSGAEMGTVATPIDSDLEFASPHVVKVVTRAGFDAIERAMYFSRAGIPYVRDGGTVRRLRHVGIYSYRAEFLQRYVQWPASALEIAESLEQLRVLEHGFEIAVAVESVRSVGVDTPADYAAFVARYKAGEVADFGVADGILEE